MRAHGLTLTELLISTAVVAIIMLGVISSDIGVRKSAQTQTASALLTLNARAVVNHIIQNASMAVGDKNNTGFDLTSNTPRTIQNNPPGPTSFCIRQDISAANVQNGTPVNYADDHWVCYTVITSNLYSCIKNSSGSACLLSDSPVPALVGPVISVAVNFNDTTNIFSATVINRTDPDPTHLKSIANPEVNVSARVSPSGQSI